MMSIKDTYHVQSIKKEECKSWFLRKHYAHTIPVIIYCFGLYAGNILSGVCSFGPGACKNLNNLAGFPTLELNRFIVESGLPKNIPSFFISKCFKLLPEPLLLVSFADQEMNHTGYIYQATNWVYTGESEIKRAFIINGKKVHRKSAADIFGIKNIKDAKAKGIEYYTGKPKHRYFYFLGSKKQKKEMLAKLPFDILPYPKGENKRYDASYDVKTQMLLC